MVLENRSSNDCPESIEATVKWNRVSESAYGIVPTGEAIVSARLFATLPDNSSGGWDHPRAA